MASDLHTGRELQVVHAADGARPVCFFGAPRNQARVSRLVLVGDRRDVGAPVPLVESFLNWLFGPWEEVVEAVPLDVAVLCEDCRCITASRNGHCRICEGRGLLNLAKVLSR